MGTGENTETVKVTRMSDNTVGQQEGQLLPVMLVLGLGLGLKAKICGLGLGLATAYPWP